MEPLTHEPPLGVLGMKRTCDTRLEGSHGGDARKPALLGVLDLIRGHAAGMKGLTRSGDYMSS